MSSSETDDDMPLEQMLARMKRKSESGGAAAMSATPVLGNGTSSTDDGADQPSPPESAPRSSAAYASGPSEGSDWSLAAAASDGDSDSSLAAAPPAAKRSRASEASDRPRPEGEELNGTAPPQTVLTVGMRVRCCFDRAPATPLHSPLPSLWEASFVTSLPSPFSS